MNARPKALLGATCARGSLVLAAVCATTLLCVPAAGADRPSATGPYAELGLGGAGMVGRTKSVSEPGADLHLHLGSDIFSWLSVGLRTGASTHEATVSSPLDGEYFQIYRAAGELRIGFRVGALAFFADGSAGLSMMSTDILVHTVVLEPGERFSPVFSAGGGLEYQLQNRHYAFGLGGEWSGYPKFGKMQTAGARFYMRYTY